MIRIRFEEYWALEGQFSLNDSCGACIQVENCNMDIRTRRRTRAFLNVHRLARWNAGRMESGWHVSRPELIGVTTNLPGITPLALQWSYNNTHGILLHEVRDTRRGILFSDGAYTKGAKYEPDEFKDLIQECRDMADDCSGLKLCDKGQSTTYAGSFEEQTHVSMSTGRLSIRGNSSKKAAEADKERREALGRAGAQYKNAIESGAADVVSKEGLDYEPLPEEKDVTSIRLNDRAIPVGAPRSTHVINLQEWERKLNKEQMTVLVTIGASGLSTYREIEEDVIKATPNASKNKLREGIRSMATMGILDEEQAVTPKARVYLYALTDVGKRLYKAKTGRDPVVSELENMRREHNNPSHGLSIRYTAEALRDSGIYRSVTYETGRKGIDVGDGQAYIPDIICEEENGRKLYIEYETGTTGQREFNNKCNKMRRVSQVLLFMATNREVAEKLVAEVKSWINNRGAGALENVEVRICAAQRVLKGARLKDDTTWNFIFKPSERGDDPIVN